MKCPHCNQEHPDGFQFCPATGKKIEVMKACTNQFGPATGKKIEVMKACTNPDCPDRYKYMLPVDSRFCPTCGKKLEENNAKTNGTLTNATDELHKFFPVADIILGETTLAEIERNKDMYEDVFYSALGNVIVTCHDDIKGIEFHIESADVNRVTRMRMWRYNPMFLKWKELGFDWNLSYVEWKNLFVKKGYVIKIVTEPHTVYWEEHNCWYLSAEFCACAPDDSIQFNLEFLCGEEGYYQQSKKTLYSINVYSKNSSYWEDIDEKGDVITSADFEEVDDDNRDNDELHKFFPVAGIVLGETTVEEVEKKASLYDYDIVYLDHDFQECSHYKEDGIFRVWYSGIQFAKYDDESTIAHVYMTKHDLMFPEWEKQGFDWDKSYEEWKGLFENKGYAITVFEEPHEKYYEGENYWYLQASFVAKAPDHSISFSLHFYFGKYGCQIQSKKTLYEIAVIPNDSFSFGTALASL